MGCPIGKWKHGYQNSCGASPSDRLILSHTHLELRVGVSYSSQRTFWDLEVSKRVFVSGFVGCRLQIVDSKDSWTCPSCFFLSRPEVSVGLDSGNQRRGCPDLEKIKHLHKYGGGAS